MVRGVFVLLILGIAASSSAETLTFPVFSIDVAADWTHGVEERASASDERGELISISRPDGVGRLRMLTWVASADVSQDKLRNLTNVEPTKLESQEWGGFSGYQYSYTERGSFYKHWWLTNERSVLFVVYDCDANARGIEIEAIDKMVSSIRMNRS